MKQILEPSDNPDRGRPGISPEQANSVLEVLFSEIGMPVTALPLLKTARVVRYLRILAASNQVRLESRQRSVIDGVAETLWGMLLQRGDIQPAKRREVVTVLKEQQQQWINKEQVMQVLKLVERAGSEMKEEKHPYVPPRFVTEHLTVCDDYSGRASSDLSERIAAARVILRTGKVKCVDKLVADKLNQYRHARGECHDVAWEAADVRDRYKQFRRAFRRRFQVTDSVARNHLYGKWSLIVGAVSGPIGALGRCDPLDSAGTQG